MLFLSQILEHQNTHKNRDFDSLEAPSSIDAAVYAFLANILWVPVNSPLKRHATALPNLEAYCQRMKARYYSDI